MEQNYNNHSKYVIGYHLVLSLLILLGTIGAFVNLFNSLDSNNLYSASLILILFVAAILIFWYLRQFALKAQDRAIKAEENLRYFSLTGKLMPKQLRMSQIIALRFASDEELLKLVEEALAKNLNAKEIKISIKNWKADDYRV
jgi:Zn-dependent protease with chaperone function